MLHCLAAHCWWLLSIKRYCSPHTLNPTCAFPIPAPAATRKGPPLPPPSPKPPHPVSGRGGPALHAHSQPAGHIPTANAPAAPQTPPLHLHPPWVLAWHQIARGLRYMHTANPMVIHRDLKLENVLLQGERSEAVKGVA